MDVIEFRKEWKLNPFIFPTKFSLQFFFMIFPWNFHHISCWLLLLHIFHIFPFYCNWKNDSCVLFLSQYFLHFIIFLAWHQFSSYFNLNGRKSIIVIIMFKTPQTVISHSLTIANPGSDSQCFLWDCIFIPFLLLLWKKRQKNGNSNEKRVLEKQMEWMYFKILQCC